MIYLNLLIYIKIKHPNFDQTNELNDILIIKLTSMVTLNEYIQITCLPNSSIYPPINTVAYAAGWGLISWLIKFFQVIISFYQTKKRNIKLFGVFTSIII